MDVDEVLWRRWRATGMPARGVGSGAATATQMVHRLGGVQAQDLEASLWSLGRRTGESRSVVLAQLDAGAFVRAHALRPTWHFLHPGLLDRVQAATAERVQRGLAGLYRQEGLDEVLLKAGGDVVLDAVRDGPKTRAELGLALSAAGLVLSGLRLGLLVMWAELERLVVNGPFAGHQPTYRAWEAAAVPDRDSCIVELAGRYFASHGPASVADFTAWSSLSPGEARQALAGLPVQSAVVEGVECFWSEDSRSAEGGAARWDSPEVELLNAYDEYVSGYSASGKRWIDRANLRRDRRGVPIGLVVVDGQLAGHWRRRFGREDVLVEVLLLRAFDDAELAALQRNADRYGEFLEMPAAVDVRPLG